MVKKVNPFNVFKVRRMDFPPDHFEYVTMPLSYNMKSALEKWIEHNLSSRYYIGKVAGLDRDERISNQIKIGFEDSKEMSFFMMACPHLKYK